MSSSYTGASIGNPNQEVVNTKQGVVYILKSDNYSIQRDSYKATIMSVGAQTLITGKVVRPAVITTKDSIITNQRALNAQDKAWDNKLINAIRIITSIVHYTH